MSKEQTAEEIRRVMIQESMANSKEQARQEALADLEREREYRKQGYRTPHNPYDN